jgi:acetyl-CoA acetyltransferase
MSGSAAIAGLGLTEVGKVFGRRSDDLAVEAVRLAVADAGLRIQDVDGLLVSYGISGPGSGNLSTALGLPDLKLLLDLDTAPGLGSGATAAIATQLACQAVALGLADTVVYVHADASLPDPAEPRGSLWPEVIEARWPDGFGSIVAASGLLGATQNYALATRRHMERFGTTTEQLGAIAVGQRAWAAMNPVAQMRRPITLQDHQNSRWIAEPLRLLDCCLMSNGAAAALITSAERARDLPQPPVYVWGWGQCHSTDRYARGSQFGLVSGGIESGRQAFAMAGIRPRDIGVRQLYDCYTFTVLLSLEDYGFCEKGEGGRLVESGELAPGGSLPTNTGGGQLSAFYLEGATPLHEGVIQARGRGGVRQVSNHDFVLVSGNGGILDHHATLILGAHPRDER